MKKKLKKIKMAEIGKVIEFLEDDKNYLLKIAENPNYSDADRRKADNLYCDIKEAIQAIRELSEGERIVDGIVDYCDMNKQCRYIRELQEDCKRYHEWGMHEGYEDAKEQMENEMCEWTLVSVANFFNNKMYRTCTDRISEKNDEYKYCPYCGRKIKVVK